MYSLGMQQRNAAHGSKIRNLDEIQEADPGAPRPSKLGALVLASLGGACVVLASVMLFKKPAKPVTANDDPLGALVSQAGTAPDDSNVDVTFPKLLAGSDRPTTALETVRDRRAPEDGEFVLPPGSPTAPPMAADRLPVVPLPAQQILSEAGRETLPTRADSLGDMARQASRENGKEVETGGPGGFQLQVSSFKTDAEAKASLRRCAATAWNVRRPADVKGRGTLGTACASAPQYKASAEIYRQEFEAKERIVSFIASPPKTKVRVAQATATDSEE
jgi:hypothetical protein